MHKPPPKSRPKPPPSRTPRTAPRATPRTTPPPAPRATPKVLSPQDARRLLLHGSALLHEPASAPSLQSILDHLAFVQLDTITTVERAHELILHARSHAYSLAQLFDHYRESRSLFEHWTHDASILPLAHYPHWHVRFERSKTKGWHLTRLGQNPARTLKKILARIRAEGPLASRHFDEPDDKHRHPKNEIDPGWWNWKPAKAALEYLWRTGQLAVSHRSNFQKTYDLPERVYPHALTHARPTEADTIDFACTAALNRLGLATPSELAHFFALIPIAAARNWVTQNLRTGRLIPIEHQVFPNAASTTSTRARQPTALRTSIAFHDVHARLAALPDAPDTLRLLAPFDPLIRDRARTLRLFNFHYRFEAFTPAAKRVHGYYVLPVLHRDQLIARIDPRHDRKTQTLHARLIQWEPHTRPTKKLRTELHSALHRLATFIGAQHLEVTLD